MAMRAAVRTHDTLADAADAALDAAASVMGTTVESCRHPDAWDQYYGDIVALGLLTPDIYEATLYYVPYECGLQVGSIGDYVESLEFDEED